MDNRSRTAKIEYMMIFLGLIATNQVCLYKARFKDIFTIRWKNFALRAFSIIVLLGLIPLISCASPVVVGPRHLGVGLYKISSQAMNPDFRYLRIEGVGAFITDERFSLGYIDQQLVHAKLEDRNYIARTPLVVFAVGEKAEAAGVEFVIPNISDLERNER